MQHNPDSGRPVYNQITATSVDGIKKLGPQTDGGKEAEIAVEKKKEKKRPQLYQFKHICRKCSLKQNRIEVKQF